MDSSNVTELRSSPCVGRTCNYTDYGTFLRDSSVFSSCVAATCNHPLSVTFSGNSCSRVNTCTSGVVTSGTGLGSILAGTVSSGYTSTGRRFNLSDGSTGVGITVVSCTKVRVLTGCTRDNTPGRTTVSSKGRIVIVTPGRVKCTVRGVRSATSRCARDASFVGGRRDREVRLLGATRESFSIKSGLGLTFVSSGRSPRGLATRCPSSYGGARGRFAVNAVVGRLPRGYGVPVRGNVRSSPVAVVAAVTKVEGCLPGLPCGGTCTCLGRRYASRTGGRVATVLGSVTTTDNVRGPDVCSGCSFVRRAEDGCGTALATLLSIVVLVLDVDTNIVGDRLDNRVQRNGQTVNAVHTINTARSLVTGSCVLQFLSVFV